MYHFAEEFILEDPKDYHFLSNKLLPVPGVDDAAEFQSTVNAMNIMGMTNEDYSGKHTIEIEYPETSPGKILTFNINFQRYSVL